MKILLTALNSKFIHTNLAIRYLKAYTQDIDYECTLKEYTINDLMEKVLQSIIIEKPDIVGFSCYIWNIDKVKKLCKLIKLVDSSINIFLGGPEVSYDCRKVLQDIDADYLIEGEGEETYREFVIKKINGESLEKVKGLYYRDDGEIKYSGERELMDMNDLVFPYNDDDNFDNKIIYYEASRGCPFKCSYCLSAAIKGLRFLNIDRVKKELDFFIGKKVRLVKFVDRTFNADRNFTYEVWKYLINKKECSTTFHFEISANLLTDDLISLLQKSPKGRIQLEIGVQTTNSRILKNIDRHIEFDDIKGKILNIQKYGNVNQHLDLIAGLPEEDFDSYRKSFNDIYSTNVSQIQMGFLKVLHGSPMESQTKKWGIVYSPYPPYEVIKTDSISFNEITILKRMDKLVDKYYNSKKFIFSIRYLAHKFETSFDFFEELSTYFYNKGYFDISLSEDNNYKVLLDFDSDVVKEDNFVLNEIVKYEILKLDKKKYVPKFIKKNYVSKDKAKEISKERKSHVELFKIDMDSFIKENKIIKGDFYYIFNW